MSNKGELKVPIYEYKCEKCPRVFEKLQKMDSQEHCLCPVCGEHSKRIVSVNSRQAGQWAERPYTPAPKNAQAIKKMTGR
jgi:putative FmdB family regulatory protein